MTFGLQIQITGSLELEGTLNSSPDLSNSGPLAKSVLCSSLSFSAGECSSKENLKTGLRRKNLHATDVPTVCWESKRRDFAVTSGCLLTFHSSSSCATFLDRETREAGWLEKCP